MYGSIQLSIVHTYIVWLVHSAGHTIYVYINCMYLHVYVWYTHLCVARSFFCMGILFRC
jgi:hypothetical protein